ncbi:hypothetical protein MMC17_006886 [Xylographa soralifera]|nr:hypothetical protein [Xylographa soralifera]MCJ1383772.1 hypothetical protein [Xylographa soralifera]
MAGPSRFSLKLRALFWRFLSNLSYSFFDRYFSTPAPPQPSFVVSIPTTIAKVHGSIPLQFYAPHTYQQHRKLSNDAGGPSDGKLFSVVINFHGGGFTIGGPEDDARWAGAVVQKGVVLISVGYRRAPEYPFPTGIEDSVAAILWVWEHAEEYSLDKSRVIISGFSAGGNFCFTVPMRLYTELEERKKQGRPLAASLSGKLAGILAFYPSVEWTQSRAERTASNAISGIKGRIPDALFELFDHSYLYPGPLDMSSPYLSPGLAPDEMVLNALPDSIYIHTCEWDQLLVEAEKFRERLKRLGKLVTGSMTKEVVHAWDKRPSFSRGNSVRDQVYAEATAAMIEMLDKKS